MSGLGSPRSQTQGPGPAADQKWQSGVSGADGSCSFQYASSVSLGSQLKCPLCFGSGWNNGRFWGPGWGPDKVSAVCWWRWLGKSVFEQIGPPTSSLETQRPSLHHALYTVWPWTRHVPSLSLICKRGITVMWSLRTIQELSCGSCSRPVSSWAGSLFEVRKIRSWGITSWNSNPSHFAPWAKLSENFHWITSESLGLGLKASESWSLPPSPATSPAWLSILINACNLLWILLTFLPLDHSIVYAHCLKCPPTHLPQLENYPAQMPPPLVSHPYLARLDWSLFWALAVLEPEFCLELLRSLVSCFSFPRSPNPWRAGTGSRSFLCCQDPAQQWAELGEQQQPLSPVPCPQLPQGKPVYSGAPHHYKEGETSQAISMGGTDCPNSVSWALQDSGCASWELGFHPEGK